MIYLDTNIFVYSVINNKEPGEKCRKLIKELINKKVSPKEVAVIYRANREAFSMVEALEKEKISYVIESDEDLLSEKFVRKIIAILGIIHIIHTLHVVTLA